MRQPPCPYFGECAGCDLQNMEYSEQLERKKHELSRLLSSHIQPEQITIHHGPELGYRNRMEFLFTRDGIGLRSRQSANKIIKIEECKICVPKINTILAGLNQAFSDNDFFIPQKSQDTQSRGTLRYAVIRATSSADSVSFVLNERSPGLKDAVEKIKAYASSSPAKNILITYMDPDEDEQSSAEFFAVKGEAVLKETLLGKEFTFSSQGFFQNNTEVAEKMHEYVHSILKRYDAAGSSANALKNSTLLDLYAGVGAFGIINASLFSQVHIVESFPGCTASAEHNLRLNSVKNAKIYTFEAHSIGRLKINGNCYIITDPPRSGMAEKAIEQIKRLKPKAIIYISCNPYQLAKDIPKFKSYSLESLAIFDLFPQTRHMEAVAELVLK